MDHDELELFAGALRQATERHDGEALDDSLTKLGWHDALVTDQRAAVSILFEFQGAANATSGALDAVLRHALGLGHPLVLPTLGRWDRPGQENGQRLSIRGIGTGTVTRAGPISVVARSGGKDVVFEVTTNELTLRPRRGVDPSVGLVEMQGDPPVGPATPSTVTWEEVVAVGQLALGHELVGATRAMLELARLHALERVQFGRPIAMFQAVRHRLADTLVAVETADALLSAAWDDPSPAAAAMAKAVAGRAARLAGRHCQQVLAGIGFTTEHPFHRYFRRILVLDQLLGGSRGLTSALGEELLRTRRLPHLIAL